MKKAGMILNRSVALIMAAAVLIVSCSMPGTGPGGIPESMLVSASGRVIDLYLDEIRPYVEDDLDVRGILDGADGYDVATRTLEEEHGAEYLAFTLASSDFSSVEEVLEAADELVPEEELEDADYETFGGYVCEMLGEVPDDGETAECENDYIKVRIELVAEHRIERMHITKKSKPVPEEDGDKKPRLFRRADDEKEKRVDRPEESASSPSDSADASAPSDDGEWND